MDMSGDGCYLQEHKQQSYTIFIIIVNGWKLCNDQYSYA